MQSALQQSCRQHARAKISADSKRFQSRSERRRRDSAVEARDHADVVLRERQDHIAKVVRVDANIAVIDEDVLVPTLAQHLFKIADLHICAENLRTNYKFD